MNEYLKTEHVDFHLGESKEQTDTHSKESKLTYFFSFPSVIIFICSIPPSFSAVISWLQKDK